MPAVQDRAEAMRSEIDRQADQTKLKTWLLNLQSDPTGFAEKHFGIKFWSRQREIAESVRDNKHTICVSAKGVGKTLVAACIVHWFLHAFPGSKIVTTATTWSQVRNLLWSEIRTLHTRNAMEFRHNLLGSQCDIVRMTVADGWFAVGLSTKDPNSFQGFHAERVLVIADEAQGIPAEIWDAFESITVGPKCRVLALVNPTSRSGKDYEHYTRGMWNVIHISGMEHPNVIEGKEIIKGAITREWIEERKADLGEDSVMFKIHVLAEYPEEEKDTVIPLAWLERSGNMDRCVCAGGVHLGVDIARFGSDDSAWFLRKGMRGLARGRWNHKDTMESAGLIINLIRKYKIHPENVHVDVIGVGGGVVDRLKEQGFNVNACNFAESPKGDWADEVGKSVKFKNRRAELYWVARCLFQKNRFRIRREWDRLKSDLCAPRYKVNSAGQIVIEEKEEIRKRVKRSPDEGDAFVMSLALPSRGPTIRFL